MGKRAPRSPVTGVTEKMEQWCMQTIRIGDPNKAYRLVYDLAPGSKTNVSAAVAALLNDSNLAVRLAHYRKLADEKLAVSIERIAKELARLGFSDMGDVFDEEGREIPFHLLPEDVRRAVQYYEVEELTAGEGKDRKVIGQRRKLKMLPKHENLRTMAQWKRMVSDRLDGSDDPNDTRSMTDEQLEAEIKANQAALEMINRAKGRKQVRTPTKAG